MNIYIYIHVYVNVLQDIVNIFCEQYDNSMPTAVQNKVLHYIDIIKAPGGHQGPAPWHRPGGHLSHLFNLVSAFYSLACHVMLLVFSWESDTLVVWVLGEMESDGLALPWVRMGGFSLLCVTHLIALCVFVKEEMFSYWLLGGLLSRFTNESSGSPLQVFAGSVLLSVFV